MAPPVVPDVTTKSFGEAEAALKQLGFTVVEEPVFDEERVDGLVVTQDPPSGSRNVGEVRLRVVRQPIVSFVSDLEAVATLGTGNIYTGSAKANGKTYSHAVRAYVDPSGGSSSSEYDLSRQYRRLSGELGLDDESSSDASYKVEIFGDGRRLVSKTLVLGQTVPVSADVTKVLRLRLSVTGLGGASGSEDSVVFGDLRTLGLQSEVTTSSTSTPPP